MKTCYVSSPFGSKPFSSQEPGRRVDFDRVYADLLKPAILQAGLAATRGDELTSSLIIHRAIFEAILGSDAMVADLTGANPNVMYETGIRHAARRGATLLVMATGSQVPFDINLTQVLAYELTDDGVPAAGSADWFRERLATRLRESLARITSDSPVYEFFPQLQVSLPPGLLGSSEEQARPRGTQLPGTRDSAPDDDPASQVRRAEAALRADGDATPFDYITLLQRYRDHSAWDDLIRAAAELPPAVAEAPAVIQLVALALNRRAGPGDRDRAIEMAEQLVADTGGDGETYGILGRIHKDRFEEHRARGDREAALASLDAAIASYRRGFELDPSDYYAGVNAVTLLMQRNTPQAHDEARALVPRVRDALHARMADGAEGYWELATELELAVVAGDWTDASRAVDRILATTPARWMIQSTARQLKMVSELSGKDAGRVLDLVSTLEASPVMERQ